MKLSITAVLTLFFGISVLAQPNVKTHLILLDPPSKPDGLAIDRLIGSMTDLAIVKQSMRPFMDKHPKAAGDIWVSLPDGKHKILHFGHRQLGQSPDGDIEMVSKGGETEAIESTNDFAGLPDSLVALDTISLFIRFTNHFYPDQQYFLEILQKDQITAHDLPLNEHRLNILPAWFISGSTYTRVRLRNKGTPSDVLWESNIKILGKRDLTKLSRFARAILATSGRTKGTGRDIAEYCTYYYGPAYLPHICQLLAKISAE